MAFSLSGKTFWMASCQTSYAFSPDARNHVCAKCRFSGLGDSDALRNLLEIGFAVLRDSCVSTPPARALPTQKNSASIAKNRDVKTRQFRARKIETSKPGSWFIRT
jgi:hypothetical protein